MKINPDCVRDLMMVLEEITEVRYNGYYTFRAINCSSLMRREDVSSKYNAGEVAYVLLQLADSGYIAMDYKLGYENTSVKMGNILYVTPKGHDFISSIKDAERWTSKIKPVAQKFGSISLSIIEATAKGVTDSVLQKVVPEGLSGF